MQRQSLGSPNSKLHGSNGGISMGAADENNLTGEPSLTTAGKGDDDKSQKPHKSTPLKPEKFVHAIPILTVLCFLILYLSSHDPSQKDLAQFNGFIRLSNSIDSSEAGFLDIEKSDVLAIRSLRNLQEIRKHNPKFRLHRKIGDF
ncbi:hypothetical protein Vadar_004169 [Vaccinium darrowii]|uniref:Uncharacterized protein n=1 Tax=Vaccinium darrowii TaxID=229202 RepID=A0ACB7WXG7_9ERIC|nr:hypothetical protein Vadar_004169 [Vaccinium darrowii]